MRGVLPRNYKAGELQSWGTAELARSVRFRQGTGTDLRDDRLIHSRVHRDTDLGGAAFGDPRLGQGDPGVKPGAFSSGLPLFLRSRRGGHGLNGHVWVLAWVPSLELSGLTGGRVALGSRGNGQGGQGAPPRGRRPTVVDGRTEVSGADDGSWGTRVRGQKSGNRDIERWKSLSEERRVSGAGGWSRGPGPRGVRYGMTGVSTVLPSKWHRLR